CKTRQISFTMTNMKTIWGSSTSASLGSSTSASTSSS
ncbi:hypothetical protein SOVF_089960, partial [Spinacia oleracea]